MLGFGVLLGGVINSDGDGGGGGGGVGIISGVRSGGGVVVIGILVVVNGVGSLVGVGGGAVVVRFGPFEGNIEGAGGDGGGGVGTIGLEGGSSVVISSVVTSIVVPISEQRFWNIINNFIIVLQQIVISIDCSTGSNW